MRVREEADKFTPRCSHEGRKNWWNAKHIKLSCFKSQGNPNSSTWNLYYAIALLMEVPIPFDHASVSHIPVQIWNNMIAICIEDLMVTFYPNLHSGQNWKMQKVPIDFTMSYGRTHTFSPCRALSFLVLADNKQT